MARNPLVPKFHHGMPELLPHHWEKGGPRGWRLLIPEYEFHTVAGGKDYVGEFLSYNGTTGLCTLKRGYSWDRCSVPWMLRGIFRRTEKTLEPGLGHDAGYELGREDVFHEVPNARHQMDYFFYWNMLLQRVTNRKARWMRWGVRTGGWFAFLG